MTTLDTTILGHPMYVIKVATPEHSSYHKIRMLIRSKLCPVHISKKRRFLEGFHIYITS